LNAVGAPLSKPDPTKWPLPSGGDVGRTPWVSRWTRQVTILAVNLGKTVEFFRAGRYDARDVPRLDVCTYGEVAMYG